MQIETGRLGSKTTHPRTMNSRQRADSKEANNEKKSHMHVTHITVLGIFLGPGLQKHTHAVCAA
jgi:hypothetical protein